MASSSAGGLRVEVHPRIAGRLLAGSSSLLRRLEADTGRRVILETTEEAAALEFLAVVPD
jgi:hypothetical protein